MKRFFSFLVAAFMMLSLSVSAFASDLASIHKIDTSSVKPLELTLMEQQITPRGRVDVYSFYIPNSDCYYELPDFRGEYTDGSHVTIEGTWSPTYARLNVMLKEMDFGSSVYSYIDCNEPTTFGLWHHSEWACFLKSEDRNISGTIRVEVT